MNFNETSPALTASQIKVERMIAQTDRIQKRIDEMKIETGRFAKYADSKK